MVDVPIPAAVATPDDPMAITDGLLLIQEPPGVGSVSVAADPIHNDDGAPLIGSGATPTLTVAVAVQPGDSVYVIVVTPADTGVTSPDVELMLATLVVLLVQVPPVLASFIVMVPPTHTLGAPVTAATVHGGGRIFALQTDAVRNAKTTNGII